MAYDESLAERIRGVLAANASVSERRMFGGLAFMVAGNMACGVVKSDLMVRLGENAVEAALSEPYVRLMDFTGKPSRTMVYVSADGVADDPSLEAWVLRAVDFASTLPPK